MNKLTDIAIKKAKATEKTYRMTDGSGLYLQVEPNGGKYWRLAYRFSGKQKTFSIGVYPEVSLADARTRREEARKLLRNNVDPTAVKQAQKEAPIIDAANKFEAIAREWFKRFSVNWKENHSSKIIARLENDVFPWIGERPIAEITPPILLTVMRRIESRGALDCTSCPCNLRAGISLCCCNRSCRA